MWAAARWRRRCWGDNTAGQASKSISEGLPIHPVDTPFVVPGLAACTQLATGDSHARHLRAHPSGRTYCWGTSNQGALGNGSAGANRPVAVQLGY